MTVKVRRLSLAALVGFIIAGAAAPAEHIVEIRLRGRFYPEPATVRLTVAVEPAPENRTLVIQADGQQLFRSSEVALEGEHGRRLHTVEFKNLPAGEYIVRAEVHSGADLRAVAEDYVVVGDPGEH